MLDCPHCEKVPPWLSCSGLAHYQRLPTYLRVYKALLLPHVRKDQQHFRGQGWNSEGIKKSEMMRKIQHVIQERQMRSLHLDMQLHQDRTGNDWLHTVLQKRTWVSGAEHANAKRDECCSGCVTRKASGGIWDLAWSVAVQEGWMKKLSSKNENY